MMRNQYPIIVFLYQTGFIESNQDRLQNFFAHPQTKSDVFFGRERPARIVFVGEAEQIDPAFEDIGGKFLNFGVIEKIIKETEPDHRSPPLSEVSHKLH